MSLDEGGSTILTEGAAPAGAGGNPAGGAQSAAPADGAQAAIQQAQNGPPEYIPAKFWDADKKAPKIEDLGKSYQNLEKLLGREKVPAPLGDEDQEGWDRWYRASGRPDKADDYEFERPAALPKGIDYDEATEKSFREWAHINGLNKKQAKNLYDGYVKSQVERAAEYEKYQTQAQSQARDSLQREYGAQYDAKMARAKAALGKYADPDYFKFLNESGQGNDPRMIRAWIKIGEEMAGDERLKGAAAPSAAPADLDRAIADFRQRHEKALFSKEHPDHDVRVREYNKLFEARYSAA